MREFFAETYKSLLPAIGYIARVLSIKRPVIFCMHSVEKKYDSNRRNGNMSISDVFLHELITHAKRQNVEIISLDECMSRIANNNFRPFICLTFDDGYRDNYEIAFPILRYHSAPATIFLATALIDRKSPMWWHPLERVIALSSEIKYGTERITLKTQRDRNKAYFYWCDRFRTSSHTKTTHFIDKLARCNVHFRAADAFESSLEWSMIKEMSASGLITFGAHTVSHPLLATLDDSSLVEEIVFARDRCGEMIGKLPKYFAYPFGRPHEVGTKAPHIVAASGFTAAFTTTPSTLTSHNTKNHFAIPRVMLSRNSENTALIDARMSGLIEILKQ